MPNYTTDKIRNIALLAHPGSGKTMLAEAILFNAGTIGHMGAIESGNTVSDHLADEIERKSSINSAVLSAMWKGHKINIIDTPGYADFVSEVICSLTAADIAVILIDAASGIELGTERIWKMLDKLNKPRMIFLNKIDKDNADFSKAYEALVNRFGKSCAVLNFPNGKGANFKDCVNLLTKEGIDSLGDDKAAAESCSEQLIEAIAESDDALLEKYLDKGELAPDEAKKALKKGIAEGKIIPVVCGSAVANAGIKAFLDVMIEDLPSPADLPAKQGKHPETAADETREPKADAPFSGQVFKTVVDPYAGQLTIFRVFSGTLPSDSNFYNVDKKTSERTGKVFQINGKDHSTIDKAIAGDIAAVAKLKSTVTGNTVATDKAQIAYPPMEFPEPAISFSVKPKSRGDEDKISGALTKLAIEDLTFKISRDVQTKELIVSGLGDLHLKIMINRLKERFGVGVDIGTPKIAYKETIKGKGDAKYRHKKQSGGAGQFAEVWLRIEPVDRGGGFEFVDEIVGGAIPAPFVVSCEKGIKGAMDAGPLAGYPVVDVRAIVYDGKTHPVDSKDIAFQIAARNGFKEAFLQAKPILLEPIMDVDVTVPDEKMGDITGLLNSKRGRVQGVEPGAGIQTIKANVPLAEMFTFISELKSVTGGRGSYTMRFSHYEEVPGKQAQAVIEKAKAAKEEAKK